ncbi:MAG: GNAT family N-acetyltransferase [Victivallaceae bacterium]|jgi:GNAT superfamily N-acetyltransferase
MMNVEILPMTLNDIGALMEIKNNIGWNQLESDFKFLIEYYPQHCFTAFSQGRIVGSVTGINYENKVAWIGMVMVHEEFRGLGIAGLLMSAALDSMKDCKCIKLDATPAGQPVYEKLGFAPEWSITRMINTEFVCKTRNVESRAEPVREDDMGEICMLDANVFGADRSCLLRRLLREYPDLAFKITNSENGKITGFCFGRNGHKYRQIGPVVAGNSLDAFEIFKAASVCRGDNSLVLDVIDAHADFVNAMRHIGFAAQRPLLRMFKGPNDCAAEVPQYFVIPGGEYG